MIKHWYNVHFQKHYARVSGNESRLNTFSIYLTDETHPGLFSKKYLICSETSRHEVKRRSELEIKELRKILGQL